MVSQRRHSAGDSSAAAAAMLASSCPRLSAADCAGVADSSAEMLRLLPGPARAASPCNASSAPAAAAPPSVS